MKRPLQILSILLFLAGAFLYSRPEDIGSNLRLFNIGFIISATGYIGVLIFDIPGSGKRWFLVFWLMVILPRLFALNMIPSDDLARYIWEGKVIKEGYNPYSNPPDSEELKTLRDSDVYPKINHKDMPAIYPPLAQYFFTLIILGAKSVNGIRLVMLLLELAVIILMLKWIAGLNLPPQRALIYALNPLVIIGIAGHGHLDSLQLLLLIAGLYVFSRKRTGLCIALITLAGMVKFLALAALPFFINKRTIKYLPIPAIIIAASYLPLFFLKGQFSFGNLGIFVGEFEFYSFSFAPLRFLFGTGGAVWITAAVVFLAAVGLWLTKTNPVQSVAPFFLIITLMSTTVHYWYLIPILALTAVWPTRYLIALSLLFLPYFDVFGLLVSDNVWQGALWRQIATYAPFVILFWTEMTGKWPGIFKKNYSVGVVVPVLNDADALATLLNSLSKTGIDRDAVVISDGGSVDDSVSIAEIWGAKTVLCTKPGRGYQISRGEEQLNTDLIIILHADNEIEPGIFEKVKKSAVAYHYAAGGACRLIYKKRTAKMKFLSFLSDIKMSIFGFSFGDQGQWFRKNAVRLPEIPLMEDVDLAMELNGKGPVVWTPAKVFVSTRRYTAVGLWEGAKSVVILSMTYLFRRRWRDREFDTTALYERYYPENS